MKIVKHRWITQKKVWKGSLSTEHHQHPTPTDKCPFL